MDAETTTTARVLTVINQVTSLDHTVNLQKGHIFTPNSLNQVFNAARSKTFSIDIDASQGNQPTYKSLVAQAGRPNTTDSFNTARAFPAGDLVELISLSAGRKLNFDLNGRQLNVDPVNGDQLQRLVEAATPNNAITINTAHAANLERLLAAISSSGNTKLIASYNGSQLVVTPTDGNYVIRAIQVAQPTTSIVVGSIGVTNINVQLLLNIVNAAG